MSNLQILYLRLDKYYQNFDDDESIDKFIETAEAIVDQKDPSSFSILLKYFNDEDYTDFVFEHLQSIMERFEDVVYVKEFLKNVHVMVPHAIGWATGMIYAILNHEECNKLMDQYLFLANKEALKSVLNFMIEEDLDNPQRQRIDELLHKLEVDQGKSS